MSPPTRYGLRRREKRPFTSTAHRNFLSSLPPSFCTRNAITPENCSEDFVGWYDSTAGMSSSQTRTTGRQWAASDTLDSADFSGFLEYAGGTSSGEYSFESSSSNSSGSESGTSDSEEEECSESDEAETNADAVSTAQQTAASYGQEEGLWFGSDEESTFCQRSNLSENEESRSNPFLRSVLGLSLCSARSSSCLSGSGRRRKEETSGQALHHDCGVIGDTKGCGSRRRAVDYGQKENIVLLGRSQQPQAMVSSIEGRELRAPPAIGANGHGSSEELQRRYCCRSLYPNKLSTAPRPPLQASPPRSALDYVRNRNWLEKMRLLTDPCRSTDSVSTACCTPTADCCSFVAPSETTCSSEGKTGSHRQQDGSRRREMNSMCAHNFSTASLDSASTVTTAADPVSVQQRLLLRRTADFDSSTGLTREKERGTKTSRLRRRRRRHGHYSAPGSREDADVSSLVTLNPERRHSEGWNAEGGEEHSGASSSNNNLAWKLLKWLLKIAFQSLRFVLVGLVKAFVLWAWQRRKAKYNSAVQRHEHEGLSCSGEDDLDDFASAISSSSDAEEGRGQDGTDANNEKVAVDNSYYCETVAAGQEVEVRRTARASSFVEDDAECASQTHFDSSHRKRVAVEAEEENRERAVSSQSQEEDEDFVQDWNAGSAKDISWLAAVKKLVRLYVAAISFLAVVLCVLIASVDGDSPSEASVMNGDNYYENQKLSAMFE